MAVLLWSKSILWRGLDSIKPAIFSSVAGGAVSRVDPDSTGLNPSWRKALFEVYVSTTWPEGSTADFISQKIDGLKQSTLVLDQLTTDSGSYLNEVKYTIIFWITSELTFFFA